MKQGGGFIMHPNKKRNTFYSQDSVDLEQT